MTKAMHRATIDGVLASVLGLTALTVYLATAGDGPFPGQPAALIAAHLDAIPRLTPNFPVWNAAGAVLKALPVGGLAWRFNAFSAVCGALSVSLFFLVAVHWLQLMLVTAKEDAAWHRVGTRLAALCGSFYLLFAAPFWTVSNRAHILSLDSLLLLAAAGLLIRYVQTGRLRWLCALALWYGVGMAQSVAFIAFAPLVVGYTLVIMWRNGDLRPVRAAAAAACALVGLSVYLLAAWNFHGSAGYVHREYQGFWWILWYMWRDQYFMLSRSLPRVGWLVIVVLTIVPWVTSLFIARRSLNQREDWSFVLLHLILFAVVTGALFNLKFAAWRVLGPSQIRTTPYLLNAAVFAYVVAYGFLLPRLIRPAAPETPSERWSLWALCALTPTAALAAVLVSPWLNLAECDARQAEPINAYAREIVRALDGREWLVTDGLLDSHLLVAAHDAGVRLRTLDLGAGHNRVYMRHIADSFEGPRYKNLAQIGMLPFLEYWIEQTPDIEARLAMAVSPDIWLGAGLRYVPHGGVFFAVRDAAAVDPDALTAQQAAFIEWAKGLPASATLANPLCRELLAHVRRQIGMVVNNQGVLLEDLGRPELAAAAYRTARQIDEANLSALLNLHNLAGTGLRMEDAGRIRAEVEELVATAERRYRMWSLSRFYGYVRIPQSFASVGWMWAMSGQPTMAVRGLKRALEAWPGEVGDEIKAALAGIYLAQDMPAEGEALLDEMLTRNPNDTRALVGKARIAMRRRDVDAARALLERAQQQTEVNRTELSGEWAALYATAGDLAQARIVLQNAVDLDPTRFREWAMLASVLLAQKDREALDGVVQELRAISGGEAVLYGLLARIALLDRDQIAARDHLERAIRMRQDDIPLRELLVGLDLSERREEDARIHSRELLVMDPRNAWGHYVIGSVQLNRGEHDLAEDSLRKSLEAARLPQALNDLAWLLLDVHGRAEEAEKLAREAAERAPEMHQAWDTLGMALMRQNRLKEADEALARAVALTRTEPAVYLNVAELFLLKGEVERADAVLKTIEDQADKLPDAIRTRLGELRARTDAGARKEPTGR